MSSSDAKVTFGVAEEGGAEPDWTPDPNWIIERSLRGDFTRGDAAFFGGGGRCKR